MKQKSVVRQNGQVAPDRMAVYERALMVFSLIYEDASINEDVIEHPNKFWEKYCFVPTKKTTSFIDYMVQKGVIDSEYNVLRQSCYEHYIQTWIDNMDYSIYEKISITEIRDFESIVKAENELCNMGEELFN